MPGGFSRQGLPSAVSDALGRLLARGLARGSIPALKLEKVLMSHDVDSADLDLFLQLSSDLRIPITRPAGGNGGSDEGSKGRHGPGGGNGRGTGQSERASGPPGLDLYFEALRACPPVAAERERALMRRVRRGSQAARDEMIRANLRLVVFHARRFGGRGVSLEDLIEEGNLGLFRAVDRFDPERGFRFSTYASWWIRHALGQAVAHFGRTVRLPLDFLRRLHQLLEAERTLTQRLGRFPTEAELGRHLKTSPRQVRRLLTMREGTLSLDAPVSPHGDGDSFIKNLPSPDDLEQIVEGHLQKAELDSWLRELTATEELILRARFGFLNARPATLSEVSRHVGRSRERVRQIEKRALRTLRARALASLSSLGENVLGSSECPSSLAHCRAS